MPYILLTTSLLLTLAGFFSAYHWWFDLASHFRLQYLGLQLLCIVLCVLQKCKKLLVATMLVAALNFYSIVPVYVPLGGISSEYYEKTIKMVLINVNSQNTNSAAVIEYIKANDPDIVALEEINKRWVGELAAALKEFPHFKEVPREDNFGIGLYSKIPMDDMQIAMFSGANVPSVVSRFKWKEKPVTLVFMHPVPPATQEYYDWRNEQFQNIAFVREQFGENFILLGDLNTTSWSAHFQNLVRAMDLKDTREGFGLQITWPAMMPILGIAIDHCLVSREISVVNRKVGPNVGSDHYPVFVELGFLLVEK